MVSRIFGPGLMLALLIIGYGAFLGGVEAGHFADNRTEYLDKRADLVESFDNMSMNLSADNLSRELEASTNSSEESEEDLPAWAKDDDAPEWAKNLSDSRVSDGPKREAPREYLLAVGFVLNEAASMGRWASIAGLRFGWHYGVIAWSIAWSPAILALYASPWIFKAWRAKNRRAAREVDRQMRSDG